MNLEALEMSALEEMKKSSILVHPLHGDESVEDAVALLSYKDVFDLEEGASSVQVALGLTILSDLRSAARRIIDKRVAENAKATAVQHLLLSLNSRIKEMHEDSLNRAPVPVVDFTFEQRRLNADAAGVVAEIYQACGVSAPTSQKLAAYFLNQQA